jgi:hypothetical protein
LDHLNIIIHPLNELLMHGGWDTAIGVNPVPPKQQAVGSFALDDKEGWEQCVGNSGKPVTLETLSLTKFSKHVFQEQEIRDSRKPGTCEASNS